MAVVDLDAKRREREAARREADNEPVVIKLGGQDIPLPVEMPYAVIEAFRSLNDEDTALAGMAEMVEGILGTDPIEFPAPPEAGEDAEPETKTPLEIWREGKPSFDDMQELVKGVMEAYGVVGPLPSSAS